MKKSVVYTLVIVSCLLLIASFISMLSSPKEEINQRIRINQIIAEAPEALTPKFDFTIEILRNTPWDTQLAKFNPTNVFGIFQNGILIGQICYVNSNNLYFIGTTQENFNLIRKGFQKSFKYEEGKEGKPHLGHFKIL